MLNGKLPLAKKHSIQFKLLYGFALAFVLTIGLGNAILYLIIRDTIEVSIETELRNTTKGILDMVQTATDVAIKNHLRAVAEKNKEIVKHFYQKQLNGELSENEAKNKAADILESQVIGTTGYIYCIDSSGITKVHPHKELVGTDLSGNIFIQQQMAKKEGYIEYTWANPGEQSPRPKALYMTTFRPWDWIIAASSYRDEFKELFSTDDFKEHILSITFGKTGYPYVIDSKGNLIIHPQLEGTNIYDSRDSSGRMFIKELCTLKNGKIIYPWQNPGELEPREKLVIFNYISELDWIVASSSYLEEFYEPLRTIGYTSFGMVVFSLILIIPITWWLSSSITRPIHSLITSFAHGAEGDYSSRLNVKDSGEIGQLAAYYNRFMEQLHTSCKERDTSEKKYRGIFEHTIEGVFQTTIDGRFISANPSMAKILGYKDEHSLLKQVQNTRHQIYVSPEDRDSLVQTLQEEGRIINFETRFRRTDDTIIWVSINARIVRDSQGDTKYIEGLISDITQRKESNEALRRAKQELEQRVEERTTELSNWINELESRDAQRSQLQKMGQMIQLCHKVEETYPIILSFLSNLFPGDDISFYIFDEKSTSLNLVSPNSSRPSFSTDQCWALRQGKPYLVDFENRLPTCHHLNVDPAHEYSCTPLIAQSELIGLLHIAFDTPGPKGNQTKAQLAARIADNLALALANIRLRETLRQQTIQDPLTGLYNRRFMDEIIATEVSRTIRRKRTFGILMIDIDHFKQVNDTHGHDIGDMVLRELGGYLLDNVRAEDVPCRFGGEEFAIIINEVDQKTLLGKATEICRGISELITVPTKKERLRITVSIGAALFPDHGDTAEDVLKAADLALYQAKEQGRNRVVVAVQDAAPGSR
ncbi:diguanylate cyclase [Desulfovibrio ferrophilus]|uniref:diguanylate cyclase n=1 Tax=Desulfovibrio ferrophilus TaxID=241368 RepID=A0A2Z6AYA2_9BACT|nr:diguanylate cyclase [Desulfovibrio ferrophilus]BBD08241.1 two component system sensor histidine kinase [Desulfovibrio ferrophilus]